MSLILATFHSIGRAFSSRARTESTPDGQTSGGVRAGKRRPASTQPRQVTLRDWLLTVVIALSVAFLIRGFLLEAFRIPTTSMEKTLLAGDFVLVSKLHYGPRLPQRIGIPFTDLFIEGLDLPPLRLPGFAEPRRGDIIVFNFPLEEKPVARKTHYIKRLIALPGDSLTILDKIPYVNGRPMPLSSSMQQKWLAIRDQDTPFPIDRLESKEVEDVGRAGPMLDAVSFQSTVAVAQEVGSWREIETIVPFVIPADAGYPTNVFPVGSGFGTDNYGPIYIPARGESVELNASSLALYRDVIERYEGHELTELSDGAVQLDGEIVSHYFFEQDYYFVMGDNRDSSYDSRLWGFVPWNHVVGKATTIYFSWNREKGGPRTDRMFTAIY